ILDYRFIEVVSELLLLSISEVKMLPIDDLSNIYQFEFLEIIKALETIQASLEHIENFKDSIWKDIPIFNNIKYPNQIIALIYQVEQCFKILESEKIILENEFGFQEIRNYAYLKGTIHKFMNLHVDQIPSSWIDPKVFEEAKEKYRELKNDIYQFQEEEYLLNIRYDKIESLDVKTEIDYILGDFFNSDELNLINDILENREDITGKLNRAELQCDIYKKSINKIKYLLNWQFTVDNNILDEITRLEEVLKEIEFNRTIINVIIKNRFTGVFNEARDLTKKIVSAQTEIKGFVRVFSKKDVDDLAGAIVALENYRNDRPIKRSDYRLFSNLKEKDRGQYIRITKIAKRFKDLRDGINELQNRFFELTGYKYSFDALYQMNYLNLYFCSIKNPMIRSKIAKFLNRVVDGDVYKNFRRTFTLFSQSYIKLNEYYEILAGYKVISGEKNFSFRIEEIKRANDYILRLFASNDRLIMIHRNYKGKYIAAEEYYKINNALDSISKKRKKLQEHKLYRDLFENHYRGIQTNINHLARLMQNYKLYTECFINNEEMVKSLKSETYAEIKKHLIVCQEETDRLNEIFKLYFKIFRDGVSRYYYNDFKGNLNYLEKLLNAKEELITYLTITDNFAVLNKYKLSKLINYIINESHNNSFVTDFKYTYYSMLKAMHLEETPYLQNYHELSDYLESIYQDECRKIVFNHKTVIQNIRKNSGSKYSVYGIKNLDYNAFIKRTEGIKHLFLSSSLMVNLFINVRLFDLVIIDDAHLLSAEEYKSALEGYQVVIAGEQQLQSAVTYNLIARIRSNKMNQFNYRFPPTPLNILSHLPGLQGQFYNGFYDNFGIDVKNENLLDLISNLLQESDNCKINVFISSYTTQRKIYDELAEYLLKKDYTANEILKLFTEYINISCLSLAYMYDAEFNILYLEDYYEIDQEHLVLDMIDNMLLCRKRAIIYDHLDRLNQNINSQFMKKLNSIINNKFTFKKSFSSFLLQQIAEKLEKQKFIVYSSSELNLIVRDKGKLYGVLLFWDVDKANFDILNDYRDIYVLNNNNNFKTIIIWSMEPSVDIIVERIVKEINNG
ncbi:MAG: hypothetical protein PHV87_05360, partial [Bacilli bacterium]|nr:hypothetical protein [Bacilli bacterium]